ncbi:hypothetical protein A3D01_00405 [Candidatus Woesebacteria bacterium RIFCSPHIGHO2_02_FULL_39_13]|uniref:ABC transporter domain-containing protein n=1 Tax=Candidatus Woesebacteria bacterium RIFCSPHIGHO2_02_FULL_39_13 TaxID=1802505 RepID=A0A1F7Z336_9BACT|nr:MAG: hypothetical protein A3D01_00405 [Candidatus Woesebacteria bacterium RIFCSPHIGHO2_02_FULL_39_13]OGM75057.1 MAG: hypothetical protein A3H19_04820 [Candidatus Woesebacteria bacterium RIFCSPLOWO2_12_FULL_39_9]
MVGIRINSLSKSFGKNLTIFRNLSLDVESNERVCLFGPSGCGKTTFLNLLAGLTQSDSGNISFTTNRHNLMRPRVGYVFQEPRLLPWLIVEKNVSVVLNGVSSKKTPALVRRMLKLVRLPGYGKKYPTEISGGEQQRVAMARALIVNPDFLFLDEPFSHLDEFTAAQLRYDLLKMLEKVKTTTVLTTHNPLEAIYLADRIVVLSAKKPTFIKRIIKTRLTKQGKKDLYREFIFEAPVKRIMNRLLA